MNCELINIEDEYTNRQWREIPHYHVDVEWDYSEPEYEEGSLEWFLSQPYNESELEVVEEYPRYKYDENCNTLFQVYFEDEEYEQFEAEARELGIDGSFRVEYTWDYELEEYRFMPVYFEGGRYEQLS